MIYFIKKTFGIGNLPLRYDQIFKLVKQSKPSNIMEIGVWTGERAKKMIKIASEYKKTSQINYFGFDLFEVMDEDKFKKEISKQPPKMEEVKSKLEKTGVRINFYKGDTTEVLPKVWESLPKMDFVFIDGGHSIETIDNDWRYVSKLMHKGSVVIFDDYWTNRIDAGAKTTVDRIDRNIYDVEILPVIDSFKETQFGPLTIRLAKVTLKKS